MVANTLLIAVLARRRPLECNDIALPVCAVVLSARERLGRALLIGVSDLQHFYAEGLGAVLHVLHEFTDSCACCLVSACGPSYIVLSRFN